MYCPNPHCQTPNPEDHKFCQKCRSPLMSRYLWAVGDSAAAYKPGDILVDRYLCKGPRIFLDTKPSLLPGNLDETPEYFIPYLKLSPHQLHIPQVYDWVRLDLSSPKAVTLLLDHAPLYAPKSLVERGVALPQAALETEVLVFPKLVEVWPSASPFRQLHWLWQAANLWQPMSNEGVASSLLEAELLRIEGPILRLLELRFDSKTLPLTALGEFWAELVQTAKPAIQKPLRQICLELLQGKIRNVDELIAALDQSMAGLETRSSQSRQIRIATLSDQGPSRQRNEDACYPPSGANTTAPPAVPLVVVCDGIGGHQGGDVASNLAIKTIEQQVKSLKPADLDATTLELELEKAVNLANDLISQQNDSEQRFDRQRMGTTVVMGVVRGHELYITHVGDSRAYWITRWGCHQITQDDDVASREVRLGYNTYPQALQQPSAGSLVQALGMGNSTNLYPTVQRFIMDEDSVFLFCSDGLSDNDQVEKYWESVLLPLLNGNADLTAVSKQLINIANTQNGYDNATVGLILCQVDASLSQLSLPASIATPVGATQTGSSGQILTRSSQSSDTAVVAPGNISSDPEPLESASTELLPTSSYPSGLKTQRLEPIQPKQPNLLWLILGIAGLIGMSGLLIYMWQLGEPRSSSIDQSPPPAASTPNSLTPAPEASPTEPSPNLLEATPDRTLAPGAIARTSQPITVQMLDPVENPAEQSPVEQATIPPGSIIYVLGRKEVLSGEDLEQSDTWLSLTVCSTTPNKGVPGTPESETPPTESVSPAAQPSSPGASSIANTTEEPASRTLKRAEKAWIKEADAVSSISSDIISVSDENLCRGLAALEEEQALE